MFVTLPWELGTFDKEKLSQGLTQNCNARASYLVRRTLQLYCHNASIE